MKMKRSTKATSTSVRSGETNKRGPIATGAAASRCGLNDGWVTRWPHRQHRQLHRLLWSSYSVQLSAESARNSNKVPR